MKKIYTSTDKKIPFTFWLPEKKTVDDDITTPYMHLRVTRKDKYKEKLSASVFFTEDGRFLFTGERGYRSSQMEDDAMRKVLSDRRQEFIDLWEVTNDKARFK